MAYIKPQIPLESDGDYIYPLTTGDQVLMDGGRRLHDVLAGCWIDFTDENGNPTDVPYIHWMEEVSE